MKPSVEQRLLELNRAFYSEFAKPFADSRGVRQDSLDRLQPRLAAAQTLLDVGCGNGRVANYLDQAGSSIDYVGIDSSQPLLEIASAATSGLVNVSTRFVRVDITASNWVDRVPDGPFDGVLLLAVLHHIPARRRRLELLRQLHGLVAPSGFIALSTWQFMSEARLRHKIVPWDQVGLAADDLEAGDYLLDWRRGGLGFRYCHLVDEGEVQDLAEAASFQVNELFRADGVSNRLNLVAVLQAVRAQSS